MTDWKYFKDERPPENVLIEATTPTGDVVELERRGNLLWSGDMYIYYTPIKWRVKK
jgi:hypothetical protein